MTVFQSKLCALLLKSSPGKAPNANASVVGKSDPARRYLAKATTLDRLFGPAWLAYGHSFAAENEHDQAMAAYFKASQLMKG